MNRALTGVLLPLLAFFVSTTESYAQTSFNILQTDSVQLSVNTDYEQFQLNAEMELVIPYSDMDFSVTMGTSGIAIVFVKGDDGIYFYIVR